MLAAVYFTIILLVPVSLCQSWASDPQSNLRPNNITGLTYYFYRWTGSYYNGSTTIRIEPQEFEEDTDKDTVVSQPVEITYENSILAIVKPNTYVEDQNELTFSLRYWDKNLNITPAKADWEGPINDIQNIDSSEMNIYYKPTSKSQPYWQLNSSHLTDTSYSFTGFRNFTTLQQLMFNCSECLSSAEFRGSILNPTRRSGRDELNVTGFPFASGQFNNRSASLRITGTFVGGDRPKGKFSNDVRLGGPITITFLGEVDDLRSDYLLPSNNGTPLWNKTLGYEKQLYENNAIATLTGELATWGYVLTVVVTLLSFWA